MAYDEIQDWSVTLIPDPDGAFREYRERIVAASTCAAWSTIADLGSTAGWYAVDRLWRLRGALDGVLGGPGNRGRPDRELRVGDPLDGWRVETIVPGRSLALVSEYLMPGTARMTFMVLPATPGEDEAGGGTDGRLTVERSLLTHQLEFHPRGRAGRLFWWAELPLHKAVMSRLVSSMAREAERRGCG